LDTFDTNNQSGCNLLKYLHSSLILIIIIPILCLPLNNQVSDSKINYKSNLGAIRSDISSTSDTSFGYENVSNGIRIFNSEFNVTISKNGSKFTQWFIKDNNIDLSDKTSEFQGVPMYSPMDIFPDLGWNEENYRYIYSLSTIEELPNVIKIAFNRTLSNGMIIKKIFEVFPDRADINITEEIFNPTGEVYNLTSLWNPSGVEGFMIDLIGLKQEKLAFRHEGGVEIDSGLHWQWLNVSNLRWVGLYEPESYARLIQPFNDTSSIYGEWTSWDVKISRLSFFPHLLPSYDSVRYKYSLYGGAIDFNDLNKSNLADFYLFATGPKIDLDMGGKWTIQPDETFSAKFEMTSAQVAIQNLTLQYYVNEVLINETTGYNLDINVTTVLNYSLPFPHPEGVYRVRIVGIVNNLDIFAIQKAIIVLDDSIQRDGISVSFVFHHHQPWYINPDENFIQPFAQSFGNLYYQHLAAQYAYPDIHVTANLQPSLIEQWNQSLNGYTIELPTGETQYIPSDSAEVTLVKSLIEEFSALGQTERLEILTSPFFHPILAILGNHGFEEDAIAQILLGKEKTHSLLDISASGLWSPEQTFNHKIIPMLNKTNVEYTILDDRLLTDSYPGFTNRQPYFIIDPQTQLQTIAFFRDSEISNNIAFNWNGFRDGDEAGREFLSSLAQILFTEQDQSKNGKIHVTLAVDGENWLTENNLLERMYQIIHENIFLTTETLGEQLDQNPPEEYLLNLREGSWGRQTSLITWEGTPAKDWVWDHIDRVRETVLIANASLSPTNSYRQKMMFEYFISQGSDYTFWEETNPSHLALFAASYANSSLDLAQQITHNHPVIESYAASGTISNDVLIFNLTINNPSPEALFIKIRARIFNEGRVLVDDKISSPFEAFTDSNDYIFRIGFPQWVFQSLGNSFDVNITLNSGLGTYKLVSKVVQINILVESSTITTSNLSSTITSIPTTEKSTVGFTSFLLLLGLMRMSIWVKTRRKRK
jgi:alpha-amylase/alpha-mannosidase (GH57 family)